MTPKKKFNEKELAAGIKTVDDPELGEIAFGELTYDDLMIIDTIQNDNERGMKLVYIMRHKADPAVTEEDIHKLPLTVSSKLATILAKESGFLKPASENKDKKETSKP